MLVHSHMTLKSLLQIQQIQESCLGQQNLKVDQNKKINSYVDRKELKTFQVLSENQANDHDSRFVRRRLNEKSFQRFRKLKETLIKDKITFKLRPNMKKKF